MDNTINVTRSSMPPFEEYCEEIKCIWDSHWLTNMGVKHRELEALLKEYLGTNCLTLFTNGHLALENIISAMKFPLGSEVITTPYTFASTTHAIVRSGLSPVFCDIDSKTFCIDSSKIEHLITSKTVAILPVHVYGNLCDVDAIASIATKYHLAIIYDAAHSFGVRYRGVSTANFGDAAMFSFHATKVFNTIEGGAVAYKDTSLAHVLNDMKNFGIHGPEEVEYVGGNAKMNEFQAAMGICNLRHVEGEIAKRKMVVERYRSNLEGVHGLHLCAIQEDVIPNYAYFPVVFDGYKYSRDEVFELLKDENIIARKYFYPITNSFDCYKGMKGFDVNDTPISYDVSKKVLTLPLYADLALEDVDKICTIILGKK